MAVVVGTLALVGVVGFFQTASTDAKSNAEIANLTALIANIRAAYYQAGADYSSVSGANLANGGIAPQPLINNGGLRSMFGQTILAAPASGNTAFSLTYSGIPAAACIKLVTMVWNSMPSITTTSINGVAMQQGSNGSASSATMGGALANCTQSNNAIQFISN
ncbi:MAG TPA: hypothetical protein HPP80_00010 [Rhodospirillaceae bacterium]|nr:hypothetical protein [Rhodospirillaceae bacterium]